MPIGVPRIIYCWGEELPAQWTDIYNFIFRRRMVFLMQYLDDELCNQICGLLINIHMEDRSKELEKKEMDKFKTKQNKITTQKESLNKNIQKKSRTTEDLLNADEDLGIEEINTLEQYTLQKITTEWLNWNAQFFDYSDEPYLFYLAELLNTSKNIDFNNNEAQISQKTSSTVPPSNEISQILQILKKSKGNVNNSSISNNVYNPFRTHLDLKPSDYNLPNKSLVKNINKYLCKENSINKSFFSQKNSSYKAINKFLTDFAQKDFLEKSTYQKISSTEKALSQQHLQYEYNYAESICNDKIYKKKSYDKNLNKSFSYLTVGNTENEFRNFYRKQTERAFIEEESKKVFVIINSFGGSVGNGITVHDALQFIKAGSLTLGLGVAASAASLVLAGGTIGERYVTEGCHTMIHQPETQMQGQASDIWIDSQEIMKIRLDVAEIYSLSTYRPRHKILRDLDRDFYLTAMETIHYGLADEIATNEVMHSIIEETNKVWDYHDSKQQRLLESRENASAGLDTQTQN